MEEIIYKIDNWSIIKLLGGFSITLIAIILFFSNYLKKILNRAIDYKYEKKLEDVKGEIEKNNSTLSSIIQNYFSSSQKILDKKIHAYEELWTSIIEFKSFIPGGINLVFQILTDEELNDNKAYENLQNNGTLGKMLSLYNHEEEMKKFANKEDRLMKFQPYISDEMYKLFFVYRALVGRITHQFIWEFQNKKVYNWKKDKSLNGLLMIVLTEKELKYIYSIEISALPNLLDLLEYKILQDFRTNLNIKDSTNDSIEYLIDIEKIFGISKSNA